MKLHYRYGWPFGPILWKFGIPTLIKLEVIRDEEADVFVGTSPDLRGLVVEADTLESIVSEAHLLIPELLHCNSDASNRDVITDVRYRDRVAHA